MVEIKAMAERGVAQHTAMRDFSSSLAESGDFDAAMTEWFRDNAALHERHIALDQILVEAADRELAGQDPKAVEPSQALTQWLAEQDARAVRDANAAQRLEAQGADAKTRRAFNDVRGRSAAALARDAQAFQRWSTVVIDSTGEVIVNDRDDVSAARYEDLARQQAALERQARDMLEREVKSRIHGDLGDADGKLEAVINELAPQGGDTAERLAAAQLDLTACAKALEQALAEMNRERDKLAGCQDRPGGCDFRPYEIKYEAHARAEAACVEPATHVDRSRAATGLQITRAELRRLGVGQGGGDSKLDEVTLIPLEPRDGGEPASPAEEVALIPLTGSGEENGSAADEVSLISLVEGGAAEAAPGGESLDLVPLVSSDGP